MKKKISVLLAICLLLGAFSGLQAVTVAADSPAEVNLLEGLIPTDFYRADIGTPQTCNYGTFSIANVGDGYHPYLYNWTDQKARIQPYIATATDGDATTRNSYRLTDSWVMIYDLGEATVLKDFEIKIGTHAGNQNSAVVKVYTATDRGAIFSSDPAATMDINWGGGGTATLNKWARFVAIVHEKRSGSTEWYSAIREITLTGCKAFVNVLAGAIPVQFCSVNTNTYNFNWTQTKVTKGSDTYQNHGFTPSDGWGRRDAFAEYLALMTDEDDSARLGIEPENRSTSRVCMVYELDDAYDVEAVQVVMNAYDDDCDVFVSTDRSTLFNEGNKIGNIVRDGNAYTTSDTVYAGVENARYVGIYMRDVYQSGICEIRALIEPKVAFDGHSLVLADQIGVNFLMNLSGLTDEEKAESYMSFEISNADGVLETDFADAYISGEKYGFTCFVSSVQMAETITPTFHYDGFAVTGKPYMVKDYIDYVVANSGSFTSQVVTLVEALGDYGHYMQIYLDNKNDWEAGEDYTVMPRYRAYDYTSEIHAAYAGNLTSDAMSKSIDSTAVTGVNYNLNFDSGTYINVKLATGDTLTAYTALGAKMIYGVNMGDYYLVRIPNLPISQLGNRFVITGAGSSNSAEFTVTLSGLSYIRTILNRVSEPVAGAKDAMAALYDYYTAAINYLTYDPSLDGELMYE